MGLCYLLKRHYERYQQLKHELDKALEVPLEEIQREDESLKLQPDEPTAVFLVKEIGSTLHTLLWVERMFPKHFKNYVFVSYGNVDTGSFGSEKALALLKHRTHRILTYLVNFARQNGIAAITVEGHGANPMNDIADMAQDIQKRFNNNVFFIPQYIHGSETFFSRFLHSDFADAIQRQLQNIGIKLLVVPLRLKS